MVTYIRSQRSKVNVISQRSLSQGKGQCHTSQVKGQCHKLKVKVTGKGHCHKTKVNVTGKGHYHRTKVNVTGQGSMSQGGQHRWQPELLEKMNVHTKSNYLTLHESNITFKVTVFGQPLLQHCSLNFISVPISMIFSNSFMSFARLLHSLYYSTGEKHKYQTFIAELPTLWCRGELFQLAPGRAFTFKLLVRVC